MSTVLTIGLATILTAASVPWVIFALIRGYWRRQHRLSKELKEMKRLERRH